MTLIFFGYDVQVEFLSFAKTLFFLKLSSEDRLLLLGCGAGTCVMASALLYDLREIRGIDLKEASSFLMMHSMPRMCLRSYSAVVGGCSSTGLLQDRMPINRTGCLLIRRNQAIKIAG